MFFKFSTITADNVNQWLSPVNEQSAYNRLLRMVQAFSTDGFLPQTDRDAFKQKIHSKMQPPVDIIFDVPLSPAARTVDEKTKTSSAASVDVAVSIDTMASNMALQFSDLKTTLDANQKGIAVHFR